VTIRWFQDADREAVVRLWREIFPDAPPRNDPDANIDRKARVQPELFLVAEEGAEIIGTAMARCDGHRGWAYYVAVHPSHRRKGVGAALMADVERDLSTLGRPGLSVQVRADNAEAAAFYRRLGYSVDERVGTARELEPVAAGGAAGARHGGGERRRGES